MTSLKHGTFWSRGIDYLGDLGAKLRDLQGYATLANELIQNADDAPDASRISFDVRETELIVDNDGTFSDCAKMEEQDCPWKDNQAKGGRRCDFHRFRYVASGDKRNEEGTIGAFGIGFLSVYQITDAPQLISAGRHWSIQEERTDSERIWECPGCDVCKGSEVPNTRFILPWAADPTSELRTAFRAEAVSKRDIERLLEELDRTLPTAILFLQRLKAIELRRDGVLQRRIERERQDDSSIITDGNEAQIWHILRGNFDLAAAELRTEHGARIESKRKSTVTLAIPDHEGTTGLLCAYLPTEHRTGLEFHINADFFPSNDRKRVLFAADYQSEWNEAAIHAAAETLADNLSRLPELLDHKRLWSLIASVKQVAGQAQQGRAEECFTAFWQKLQPRLADEPIIFTTQKEWRRASKALFLYERKEAEAVPLLERLGLSIVHDDLRPHQNLLLGDVGMHRLDVDHLVDSLESFGLTERKELSHAPPFLRRKQDLAVLWREVERLLNPQRRSADDQEECKERLAGCAIALGQDGALWPCEEPFRTDQETRALFSCIDPTTPFLADLGADATAIAHLCPEFTASDAVRLLTRLGDQVIQRAHDEDRLSPSKLLKWFESRAEHEAFTDPLKQRIAKLPIFPSSTYLQPLTNLSLPGDFEDPIGIAGLVDLKRLGGRRDFLNDLGARKLTFLIYAEQHVPSVFTNDEIPVAKKRAAIQLLAERRGEIQDTHTVREVLAETPIVECEDGVFRRPHEVYFPSPDIKLVLGSDIHTDAVPDNQRQAVDELYDWLGVARQPRYKDVVARIGKVTATTPNADSLKQIRAIFSHLGDRLQKGMQGGEPLGVLRSQRWLPASGEYTRWYEPGELYADFQRYLFASQARFLDLSQPVQRASGELLQFLGIETVPSVRQVCGHLLHCASTGTVVNKEVYRFLNDNADDDALRRIEGTACLLLENNQYVKPSEVFWSEHGFGRFRYRLGSDLRGYDELLTRLCVRDVPDHTDALNVIEQIAADFGAKKLPLDDEAYAVLLHCWRMLEDALRNESIESERLAPLQDCKVTPNAGRFLTQPDQMFFDDRAGLAAKFGDFLRDNVIPRPQGAWQAMEAAGVRSLSGAVKTHLVECVDPVDDERIPAVIAARHKELARVVEGYTPGLAERLCQLDDLRCKRAGTVVIQYEIRAFNRERQGLVEPAPAHYVRDAHVLYFVPRNGMPPWTSIARELALIISAEAEPGLALGIKEVLAAETDANAQAELDELGYATLSDVQTAAIPDSGFVGDFGGEEGAPAEEQAAVPPRPERDTEGTDSGEERGTDETRTTDEAIDILLGPGTPTPTALPEGLVKPEFASGAGSRIPRDRSRQPADGTGRRPRGERRRTRGIGRLRTYVTNDLPDEDLGEVDEEGHAQRTAVARAGLDHVLAYEREAKRIPTQMPNTYKGYDIESRKRADGEVERYIEVKSLSGSWSDNPSAALTRPEFEKAEELGDRYWLYVVERAEQDDSQVYPIRDPARKVNQFIYDDGWQALAQEIAKE